MSLFSNVKMCTFFMETGVIDPDTLESEGITITVPVGTANDRLNLRKHNGDVEALTALMQYIRDAMKQDNYFRRTARVVYMTFSQEGHTVALGAMNSSDDVDIEAAKRIIQRKFNELRDEALQPKDGEKVTTPEFVLVAHRILPTNFDVSVVTSD